MCNEKQNNIGQKQNIVETKNCFSSLNATIENANGMINKYNNIKIYLFIKKIKHYKSGDLFDKKKQVREFQVNQKNVVDLWVIQKQVLKRKFGEIIKMPDVKSI